MDPVTLVEAWADNAELEGDLVHLEHLPAREAVYADLDPPLPAVLRTRLAQRGVTRLYRHQVEGIRHVRSGRHTVLVAGTASGKTLAYQAPIVEAALADHRSGALLVYPTKALAQDQFRSFRELDLPEVRAATYDGDTPGEERARIRRSANVVLTNPDMLHVGILPHHERWADFLHRLAFVVVDEMHTLRGIFGTHVALVLRRLRRLCAHYGSSPTFVFASATIGNPGDLASGLCGLDVQVVDRDDSPRGDQWVALWNPALVDAATGRRRSALSEATDLLTALVRGDVPTIAFARSRKSVELLARWARERLDPERRDRVAPYRAGYLPEQRRAVERRLFSGELLAVVTTTALELGIDVGALDAAILVTFPGTIAAFRQQAGRAGRTRRSSLVTLVGGEDALDQYFMSHPLEIFRRSPEDAVINPANPLVAEAHVACAAHEIPLRLEDREVLGPATEEAANRLVQQGHLRLRDDSLVWARRVRPAPRVDIRVSGGPSYAVLAGGELLATLDQDRVFRDGHEGAVYLHQGEGYVVDHLDLNAREAHVHRADVDYYTQPKVEKDLEVLDVEADDRIGPVRHFLGRVRVESHVVAYQRRKAGTSRAIDTVALDLPPTAFETQAVWFAVPDAVLDGAGVTRGEVAGTLHAAEHAAIALLPLLAVCDRWDIGGLSTAWHPATGSGAIFIYEAYPGGAGISPVAHAAGAGHLASTLEAIRSCPCTAGCPSCVQSPKCGNFNDPLSKDGAVRLLEAVLRSGGR